jgi:hypothetical protein
MDLFATLSDDLPKPFSVDDPLGFDEESDAAVVTTRRAITRVAFVAAETASRFQREGIEEDPMAWLTAPRKLFDGAAAIDACLDLDAFVRATIFHGLSLGLDAEPEDVEDLYLVDDVADDLDDSDYVDLAYRTRHLREECAMPSRHRRIGEGVHVPDYNRPAKRGRPEGSLRTMPRFDVRKCFVSYSGPAGALAA